MCHIMWRSGAARVEVAVDDNRRLPRMRTQSNNTLGSTASSAVSAPGRTHDAAIGRQARTTARQGQQVRANHGVSASRHSVCQEKVLVRSDPLGELYDAHWNTRLPGRRRVQTSELIKENLIGKGQTASSRRGGHSLFILSQMTVAWAGVPTDDQAHEKG